ncbi:MAG TPA: peroxidase-related enzyme [Rhodothermales bacterium]|nr:peroxidase-related enzyme [Rhodothermales bacterium]
MAHVPVPEGMPGIRGLMAYRPETALPLNHLVEVLLQGPSPLTKGERELIATYVSSLNRCKFCASTHGAVARHHLNDAAVVQRVIEDPEAAEISPKLKALMRIAARVQQGGRTVTDADVATARAEGATDVEIHDAVLIAAAFCMFNRYVDGLATSAPDDPSIYDQIGSYRAANGYLAPSKPLS